MIDGRKRLAACALLGIEPKVVNLDPEQDAEQVAMQLNILRTHYSPGQRMTFAAEQANVTRTMSRQVGDDARRSGEQQINGQLTVDRAVTIAQAAREAGVSPSAVSRARKVLRGAAPEVVTAMKKVVTVSRAAKDHEGALSR